VVLHPPGTGSPVIVKKAADSVTTTPGGIADESVAPITELLESRDKESPAERIEAAPSPSVGRHAAHDGPRGLTAVIQQSDAQQPARMPGAPAEADRDPTSQSAGMSHPIPVIVEGIHCSRGHLNDPRVAFCASCGIRMDNRTAVPVHGRRPPLGLLLLDDGVIHVLDDDCLLGRRPDTDEAVVDGRFRSIRLDDDRGSISRVHAEIRLHNWDTVLVDRGSANGTYIAGPTDTDWSRLVPFQPLVLTPGTQVRIGRRQLTYQSARAQL
jgi:hypothetical protein